MRYEETPITSGKQISTKYDLCHKTVLNILQSTGKRHFEPNRWLTYLIGPDIVY